MREETHAQISTAASQIKELVAQLQALKGDKEQTVLDLQVMRANYEALEQEKLAIEGELSQASLEIEGLTEQVQSKADENQALG